MQPKITRIALATLLLALFAAPTVPAQTKLAHPEALVDAEWLRDNFNAPDTVIIDASDHKDDTYQSKTIKSAVFVPYRDLRKPSGLMKGIVYNLEKQAFNPDPLRQIFRKAGVNKTSTVVVVAQYRLDDAGMVFWALKWLGHDDVRLLPVNYLEVLPEQMLTDRIIRWDHNDKKGNFTPLPDWSWYATRDDVIEAIDSPFVDIWDLRSESYFKGKKTKTIRGGTVATARNWFFMNAWKDKTASEIDWQLVDNELSELFPNPGSADRKVKIISLCNTGHVSGAGFLAWQMGHQWALCDASWNFFAYDGELPVDNIVFHD